MPKKKFFLFSLLLIFAFSFSSVSLPVKADETTTPTTNTAAPTPSWWDSLIDLVRGAIENIKGTPTSKPIQINSNVSENMNYNSPDFDYTTRARSLQDQTADKGKYLYQMLNNQDGYEDLELEPSGCNKVKLSQMVYYFYSNHKNILYDLNGKAVDYDPTLMEKYKTDISDLSSYCANTMYDRMSSVPQGKFYGKTDTATSVSTQLNNNHRNLIPYQYQTGSIPQDNTNQENAKIIINDNVKKEISSINLFTPNSQQTNINDLDYLRQLDALQKQPDSWNADDTPERDENTPLLDATEIVDANLSLKGSQHCTYSQKCNGQKSHCRGMSQYGAYGMAKSGKTYEEILKFYYGDIAFTNIGTNLDIGVSITRSDSQCSKGQLLKLNFETYLTGLGELSDEWGRTPEGQELFKAQVIAARTYAFIKTKGLTKPICNTANCQVFRCSNLGSKGKANFAKAVQATAGLIIVDATNKSLFPTEYARSFCGSSVEVTCDNHTIPAVNAAENIKYERLGHPKNLYCKNPV